MTNTSPAPSPSSQPPKKRKRPSSHDDSDKSRKTDQISRDSEASTSPQVASTPPFSPMIYQQQPGPQHAHGPFGPPSCPLPPPLMQIHPHMVSVIPGTATAYYHPGLSPQLYPHYGPPQRYPPTSAVVSSPNSPHTSISPAGTRYNAILPKKESDAADAKGTKGMAQPLSTMPPPSPNMTYTQHAPMYHPGHQYVQISPQLPPNMVPVTPPASGYMHPNLSPSLSPSFDGSDRNRRVSSISSLGTTADQREQARKESHSAIERRRRERINDKILQLKQLIPSCADQDHLHKMSILQSAIDYIAYLKDIIEKQGGKDLLHGKLAIKTVRSMLPKEVEAFTGQFSVKSRTSVSSMDSNTPSPAWAAKQSTEIVQQMDLGPPLAAPTSERQQAEEDEQSEYHSESESSTSSRLAAAAATETKEVALSLPSPSGKASDDGYDSATTPLKPSDLMKNPPRQTSHPPNDATTDTATEKETTKATENDSPAGSEQCARSLQAQQNESSMSVSQMLC
ncbi:hypothetical protein INT44_005825 [Umbelopsis vinacea]|uniref:BHLH domain-containing protein n=1 Tax=Umbelopsis vinacea TaxID=44442 RepID=A0A8H7UL42_9FUNG|nr:hypothetical protein INT44_005825 [Umbelopsis vinacea]